MNNNCQGGALDECHSHGRLHQENNMHTERPSCYLHIGAPKTGTTFLQKVLSDNREALLRQGILYPAAGLRGLGHHDFAFLLAGGYPEWATSQPASLEALAGHLAEEVAKHAGPVILSSENFYLYPQPERLKALLHRTGIAQSHNITLIVYIRRQDLAHESWYNQTIKAQGYTHGFDACIDQFAPLWDYQARLRQWAAVFGQHNMVVRPYEQQQLDGHSLLQDFARITQIDTAALTVQQDQVNTGLNRDALEFQRLLNALPLPTPEKRQFHRQLIELSRQTAGSGLFDETPLLDARRSREIMARYDAGNLEVARTYLHQEQLFLEPLAHAFADASAAAALTVEKMAMITGWLMLKSGANRKDIP
jgi:hypothetical protein